eukprot:CAMPEP_0185251360 /NCGR_PEP_ID=MMETSP1359-20130426/768_1 /TAXON_ID=552665 /ORGANISM="Bigelowiella longifila, Strain CCMP242" /LENGTH=270 /DNA_ID=CAMNT_0027833215 /DNA_START=300 /DNA_END=1112 /DNA_ORIENTATION=+
MEQISMFEKKLEDFSKFEVLEIVESLRKEARAPLDERAQKAKEIENKLKNRQKMREDYSYYLGKVRKLKETHKIHLKNGQVEKLTFTEKLERNEKKVEACKDTFEKHSAELDKDLTKLLASYPGETRQIVLRTLSNQKKLFTNLSSRYVELSQEFQKVNDKVVDGKLTLNKLDVEQGPVLGLHVVVHDDGAAVREGRSFETKQIECIPFGTQVTVIEIVRNRARINKPIKGWVSIETRDGEDILVPKRPPKTPEHYFGESTGFFQSATLP